MKSIYERIGEVYIALKHADEGQALSISDVAKLIDSGHPVASRVIGFLYSLNILTRTKDTDGFYRYTFAQDKARADKPRAYLRQDDLAYLVKLIDLDLSSPRYRESELEWRTNLRNKLTHLSVNYRNEAL